MPRTTDTFPPDRPLRNPPASHACRSVPAAHSGVSSRGEGTSGNEDVEDPRPTLACLRKSIGKLLEIGTVVFVLVVAVVLVLAVV